MKKEMFECGVYKSKEDDSENNVYQHDFRFRELEQIRIYYRFQPR